MQFELEQTIIDLLTIVSFLKLPSTTPPAQLEAMDRLRETAKGLGLPVPKDSHHD